MNAASSSASLWYAVSLDGVGNELGDDGALVADGDRLVARRRRRLGHAASGKVSSRSR